MVTEEGEGELVIADFQSVLGMGERVRQIRGGICQCLL